MSKLPDNRAERSPFFLSAGPKKYVNFPAKEISTRTFFHLSCCLYQKPKVPGRDFLYNLNIIKDMKKLIPILLAVFALASCEKDPDMGKLDDNYLVYTNYDKKADFQSSYILSGTPDFGD